jgi:Hsp20/alpha crystallin family
LERGQQIQSTRSLTTGAQKPSLLIEQATIEKEEKEENFRRVERQYGSFTRSFTLPSSVDPGQVTAHYDKGVLKIFQRCSMLLGSWKSHEVRKVIADTLR